MGRRVDAQQVGDLRSRLGVLTTLSPRPGTCCISRNHTVLAMRPDGSIAPEPHVGLFVCDPLFVLKHPLI